MLRAIMLNVIIQSVVMLSVLQPAKNYSSVSESCKTIFFSCWQCLDSNPPLQGCESSVLPLCYPVTPNEYLNNIIILTSEHKDKKSIFTMIYVCTKCITYKEGQAQTWETIRHGKIVTRQLTTSQQTLDNQILYRTGENPIILFTAVIYECLQQDRAFVPCKPFETSLIVDGKARTYPIEDIFMCST